MAVEETEGGDGGAPDVIIVRHRRGVRQALMWAGVVILVLVAAAAVLWIERRDIANSIIQRQLASKGVHATYTLDRVGPRTEEVSNLVIGDPAHPDLTAKKVLIQLRLTTSLGISAYRIVARGVRLRGKVMPNGRVSWGEIDRLLPPPSKPAKPFTLPNIALDVADSSISLATPWGPFGFAMQGSGNLSGGFSGHVVSYTPQLVTAKCIANNVRGVAAIDIKARHPHVIGPLTADRFVCPASRFSVIQPHLDIDSKFTEAFGSFDGKARIISQVITAGDNGLAALNGTISLTGNPSKATGAVDLTAQKSRLGTIAASMTRVVARYQLGVDAGTLVVNGRYDADHASLAPSMVAGFVNALNATRSTPIGGIAAHMGHAISAAVQDFDVDGGLTLVNFPGGGGARVVDALVVTPSGGRARIFGGKGVTYYWPTGRLRFDGTIQMAGGGLPTGSLVLHQAANGALDGSGNFQPYVVGNSRLSLATLRFAAQPSGATSFATVAGFTGSFSGGSVRALTLPISGQIAPGGGILVGPQCMTVSFSYLQMQQLQLGPARLPVCPVGPAIISQTKGGPLHVGGRIEHPLLAGRIGQSPMRLGASSILLSQTGFNGSNVGLRLGKTATPLVLNARTLAGSFGGGGASGTVGGADAVIGKVPLKLSEIDGRWHFAGGRLAIDGGLTVSDRADPPKFYPLKSDNTHFVLANSKISAAGTLKYPATGTKVTDVTIAHDLTTGNGHANLDVPGITFATNGLQPDQLTPLTEGVVALVNGTLTGHGQINWTGKGEVTSTGDFATRNMDLAAPFGPVTGLATSIHFTDLLGMVSSPGQVATVASINPGITVNDGVIHYQLLPNHLVKIERGEWPFMGGQLVLRETILNFGAPSQKRLTFELHGFDAKMFVDSLGFQGLEITGKFDGVLPMIFDENGGRIVGGRLDSEPPGGEMKYSGTKPSGLAAGAVFALVSDLNYRSMIVRLDGDLAGEFATRLTLNDISLGKGGGLVGSLVRSAFSKLPMRLNVNIHGPFRALIQMAKAFKDPTQVIAPVMPFPIDSPALKVEVQNMTKQEDQAQTKPAAQSQPANSSSPSPPGGQK
jgi:hypothetical protein